MKKLILPIAAILLTSCNDQELPASNLVAPPEEVTANDSTPGVYATRFARKTMDTVRFDRIANSYIPESFSVCQTSDVLFTVNTNDKSVTIEGTETCDGNPPTPVDRHLTNVMMSEYTRDRGENGFIVYWSEEFNSSSQTYDMIYLTVYGNYDSVKVQLFPDNNEPYSVFSQRIP